MRQLIIKDRGVLRSIIIKEGNLPKISLGGNGFEERLGKVDGTPPIRP
ncbi:MAG: hypothetical protein LWX51_00170 [Deltaproteobacteria bacterium]|jgi:hypothetical protein|nr:hypothetical protein [Deltaproteobacteria bacterium]